MPDSPMASASVAASAEPIEEADIVPPVIGLVMSNQKQGSVLKKSGVKKEKKGTLKVGFSIEEPECEIVAAY